MAGPTGPTSRRWAGHSDLPRRWGSSVLLVLALGCAGDGAGEARPVSAVLPTLTEVPIPVPELSPGAVTSAIVAGPDGGWLFGPSDVQASALVLVAPVGRRAVAVGGYGEGPGEMRLSLPLWLDDTAAIGFDLATRRLMLWDRTGTLRREWRPTEPVVPIARGPGQTLLASRFRGGREVPVLVEIGTGAVRDVIPPDDSTLLALFRDDAGLSDRIANAPVIGRWRDGIVVGNGLTYRIGLWRRDGALVRVLGRDLPPARLGPRALDREMANLRASGLSRDPEQLARARARLAETPQPRFTHFGAPRPDERGRLWVVVQEGDSVAADVFGDEAWLGRVPIECPGFEGRWDLNGRWLLLVCDPRDPASDLDAEVRRYRIVEP